ncbi:MAG: serine hydrolase [Pseudohongiellaceae bacterium]
MKKPVLGVTVAIVAVLGVAALSGFTPAYLISAPGVAAGIGAKLLCSSRYVSHFSQEQSFDDLVQYSPVLANLTIEYDETDQAVITSLFGLKSATAVYRPGLGCTLEYPGFDPPVDTGRIAIDRPSAPWPLGERTTTPDAAMQALVQSQIEQDNSAGLNTRALLVVHDGEVIAEGYAQNADRRAPLLGWSMSKSLMSIMLGNLELRGLLSLDAGPEFPEWADDDRAAIRITDLLTMTDGLDFSEEYDPGDDATAMLFTEPSASLFVLQKSLSNEPGTVFNYSSGTASLLSRLYQDKTGDSLATSFDDYMENIYKPLGFEHAVFETDAAGEFMGSSYFYASARDWARIGQMMLDGGSINGRRIVSEDWIQRATGPNTSENEKAYGYQWWLNRGDEQLRWPDLPADAYAAQGNREQRLMVIPSRNLVIVRLGWTAGSYPTNERFAEILDSSGLH